MSKHNNDLNALEEFWDILEEGVDLKKVENFLGKYPDALEAKNPDGDTPLIIAARNNNDKLAELLISKGCNLDAKNLHENDLPIRIALHAKSWKLVELLIDNGADLNLGTGSVTTLMHARAAPFEIIEKIIGKGVDIHAETTSGISLLSMMYKFDNHISVANAEKLLNLTNEKGEPLVNVNKLNSKGDRVIDIVNSRKNNREKAIDTLRKHGSVEPQNPVGHKYFVDISNGRLDLHKPNELNAPKLLNKLYKKFPLLDDKIDEIINAYKARDFGDWKNTVYKEVALTIPEVINELISLGEVSDRLPITWEFKKVIATAIHAIDLCDGNQKKELSSDFLNCLLELKMCKLGKLINILAVAQKTIRSKIIDSKMEKTEFIDSIITEVQEQLNIKLDKFAPEAFIKWFFANYARSTGTAETYKPEEMSLYSQKIMGIFNQSFIKATDDGNGKLLDSSAFQMGLEGKLILPLLRNIGSKFILGMKGLDLGQWEELFVSGMRVLAEELLNKALNHKDDLENFIEQASYKPEYMLLKLVDKKIFEEFLTSSQDTNFAKKILKIIDKEFGLNPEATNFINSINITDGIITFSSVTTENAENEISVVEHIGAIDTNYSYDDQIS